MVMFGQQIRRNRKAATSSYFTLDQLSNHERKIIVTRDLQCAQNIFFDDFRYLGQTKIVILFFWYLGTGMETAKNFKEFKKSLFLGKLASLLLWKIIALTHNSRKKIYGWHLSSRVAKTCSLQLQPELFIFPCLR